MIQMMIKRGLMFPTAKQFHCTDPHKDANHPPKCPPTYCDPTRGTCQCCTSIEWADADASDLPPLCDVF